jgi:hypothetical protein
VGLAAGMRGEPDAVKIKTLLLGEMGLDASTTSSPSRRGKREFFS